MKNVLAVILLAVSLGGCAVYPAAPGPYYEPAPAYVTPPVYLDFSYIYRDGGHRGYHGGYRGHHH